MLAKATAISASRYPIGSSTSTAMIIAPTSTIPWIELAPDISGVCRVAGTLLMTAKPTRIASVKIVRLLSRSRMSCGITRRLRG
jgi:hypothetical protein